MSTTDTISKQALKQMPTIRLIVLHYQFCTPGARQYICEGLVTASVRAEMISEIIEAQNRGVKRETGSREFYFLLPPVQHSRRRINSLDVPSIDGVDAELRDDIE